VRNQNVYVDNYRPGARPQTAKQFADALDSFTSAMAKAESGLFKDIREEKERKGAIAGALGISIEQVPDESKDPAIRTRNVIKGQAAAAELRAALNDYYQQNRDLPPDQFNQGIHELKRGFLLGKDRSYIEGLLSKGLKFEQEALTAYYNYVDEKDRVAFLDETMTAFSIDVEEYLSDPNITSQDAAELIYERLTQLKEINTLRGTDRVVTERRVLDEIGLTAIELGRPDLLDFTDIPNKDGVSLYKTVHKPVIAQYRKQAEAKAMEMRFSTTYEKVHSLFTTSGGGVNYGAAVRALADPKYQQELGITTKEAFDLQRLFRSERDDRRREEVYWKDKRQTAALEEAFMYMVGDPVNGVEANASKARSTILNSRDIDFATKKQLLSNIDQTFKNDKTGYNRMTQMIVNGDITLPSEILKQAGTMYSVTDAQQLVNFLEELQKPEAEAIKNAMTTIKSGVSNAGMFDAVTPQDALAVQAAQADLLKRIKTARENGEDITPMLSQGNSKYVLADIINTHRITAEQRISEMKTQAQDEFYNAHSELREFTRKWLESTGRDSSDETIDRVLDNPENVKRIKEFMRSNQKQSITTGR
jgi:hypothetical protein